VSDRLYDFSATKKHETEAAVLLDCGEEEDVWFPKRFLEDNGDGTWTVPEWLAMDKEII